MASEKVCPSMSLLRDPNEPTNQTIPLSMRDSGNNLDPCCAGPGGGIQEAGAGKMGVDKALRYWRNNAGHAYNGARLLRVQKLLSTLARDHLALEKKYLELVKLLFEVQPSPFVQHHRQILADQLSSKGATKWKTTIQDLERRSHESQQITTSKPSGRVWAKKLGISHTWLQKLVRQFQSDPTEMWRDVRRRGNPTFAELVRAQERTRQLMESGGLRGSHVAVVAKFLARKN
jgi:hypothetical protein